MTTAGATTTAQPAKSRGVLLIGHGTRDTIGTDQFFELSNRLAFAVDPMPVKAALLEFQQPTISQAWQALAELGIRHIHVAPLLLFAAGHAKQDIPQLIDQCSAATPEITYDQSLPLSRHQAIVDLVVQRVQQVLSGSVNQPDSATRMASLSNTALVMVGRGSRDPCAQADLRVLAELIDHRLGVAETLTSFYAMAEPKFADQLQRVAASGRFEMIMVHPHLLFAGRLYQAIVDQTDEVAKAFPAIQFVIGQYLGPDQQVARAIADRINQSASAAQCRS